MALKSISSFLALLALSSLFSVSTAYGSRKSLVPLDTDADADTDAGTIKLTKIPPGFTLLNPKDPKVRELATFAIGEYNKTNYPHLVFSEVVEAISNADGQGTDYGLAIVATKGKDPYYYFINISVVNGVKRVTSFNQGQ